MHTAQQLADALSGPIARDRTIILVTHHISLCLPIASYLVELSKGAILQHGTVQDLRERGVLDKVIEKEDIISEEQVGQEITASIADGVDLPGSGDTKGKLVEDEARAEGRISIKSYTTYIRAAGISAWIITLLLMISIRLITVANQVRCQEMFGSF
jgi:ABC-type multidrug transport system ATPase subunit